MDIIIWIVFGFVAGAIAKLLMPGNDPGGWLITILLGVAGSFLGGFIGSLIFSSPAGGSNEFSFSNMALAIVGAIILLALYRMIKKKA